MKINREQLLRDCLEATQFHMRALEDGNVTDVIEGLAITESKLDTLLRVEQKRRINRRKINRRKISKKKGSLR